MAFRVSIFWSMKVGVKIGGWSENWWNTSTDASSVNADVQSFLPKRWKVAGYGANIIAYRIQDMTNARAVQPVPLDQYQSTIIGTDSDADYPTQKGLLQLSGPSPYLTKQWLGAIRDDGITLGGQWTPGAVRVKWFNDLFAELTSTAHNWAIRTVQKVPKIPSPPIVTAVTMAGLVSAVGHGLDVGNRVRITRTHGVPGLNRIWTVVVKNSADQFTITPPAGGFTGAIVEPLGLAVKQVTLFQAIKEAKILQVTKHNVGRPFRLFTGRRKRRAS